MAWALGWSYWSPVALVHMASQHTTWLFLAAPGGPGLPLCTVGTSRPCPLRLICACFPIKFSDRVFSF